MNFPDIINTPIVAASNDVFWDNDRLMKENLEAKEVLVISSNFSNEEIERNLLLKILEACKLHTEQYNLLVLSADEKLAWHLLKDKLGVQTILLFGIEPQQLGVNVQLMPHQTNRFNNCNWIPTASLAQIQQQPELKAHLWNYGLKPVFVDKIYG